MSDDDTMICPNCEAKMNEGDPCPECDHIDGDDYCDCNHCLRCDDGDSWPDDEDEE